MTQDCIFCKIASGQIPATLLYQDEDALAFRDVAPQAPVHLLVISRKHFSDLPELANRGGAALSGHLLWVASKVAQMEGLGQGFRLVTNTGPAAGQSVPHVHFHVLGGRNLSWPPG